MNLKFTLNEYILIWNLLFRQSISKELNNRKQKIWINYKKEYNTLYNEKKSLLQDPRNYIPNNDVIYNIMKEQEVYNSIYKYTDKYKLELIETWDENKKNINKELKNILRTNNKEYQIYLMDPRLNTVDEGLEIESEKKAICYGKRLENKTETLIDLIYRVFHKEMNTNDKEHQDIVNAVLELCILNELATRITGKSHYLNGTSSLKPLKKQIYPYFLMYLGVEIEDMSNFMRRDGILFDKNRYLYQEKMKKMDIDQFLDFCIRNQQLMVKTEELEVI